MIVHHFFATSDYVGFYFVIILLHLSLSQKNILGGFVLVSLRFVVVCWGLCGCCGFWFDGGVLLMA
jgi:hypothetical protein